MCSQTLEADHSVNRKKNVVPKICFSHLSTSNWGHRSWKPRIPRWPSLHPWSLAHTTICPKLDGKWNYQCIWYKKKKNPCLQGVFNEWMEKYGKCMEKSMKKLSMDFTIFRTKINLSSMLPWTFQSYPTFCITLLLLRPGDHTSLGTKTGFQTLDRHGPPS